MGDQDLSGVAADLRVNRLRRHLMLAACAGALLPGARAEEAAWRRRGRLRIAVYRDFPPFSKDGDGIDVRLGQALAQALQAAPELLVFEADEKVDDDLRNMVWRGTVLGYGPADVMLHVPVDPAFARRNPKVRIFAPYFREKLQVARNVARIARLDTLAALEGQPVGAENATLASAVLLSADGGRLRGDVHHYPSTWLALEDLKAGRLAAVMGLRSELSAALHGLPGFAISDAVEPGIPAGGWTLGLAVKADQTELAAALQTAVDDLMQRGRMASIFEAFQVAWAAP